jgi:hypothetical protein
MKTDPYRLTAAQIAAQAVVAALVLSVAVWGLAYFLLGAAMVAKKMSE